MYAVNKEIVGEIVVGEGDGVGEEITSLAVTVTVICAVAVPTLLVALRV
jgi:hypothetical protein